MEEESKAVPIIAEHTEEAEVKVKKSPGGIEIAEVPKVVVHVLRANGIAGYTKRKGKEFSDAFATLTLTSKPTHSFSTKTIKRTIVKLYPKNFLFCISSFLYLTGTNLEPMVLFVNNIKHFNNIFLVITSI